MYEDPGFDCLVMHLSDDNPLDDDWWTAIVRMDVDNIIDLHKQKKKPVVAVLSGARPGYDDLQNIRWRTVSEQRTKLAAARVPAFDTTAEAMHALAKYIGYWEWKRNNP
jgi:acyl-CoA synthetase (NDP forming)